MKNWEAINHSRKANIEFPTDSNGSVQYIEDIFIHVYQALIFTEICLLMLCVSVHLCTDPT